MLLLKTKKAGLLTRKMRGVSVVVEGTVNGMDVVLIPVRKITRFGQACIERIQAREEEKEMCYRNKLSTIAMERIIPSKPSSNVFPFGNFYNNGSGQDLRRFLEEVGTDPKEARFWLKHFKRSSESYHPFAVVQVDCSIFRKANEKPIDLSTVLKVKAQKGQITERFSELDLLASTLAFLHRNNMKVVIVHGVKEAIDEEGMSPQELQTLRSDLALQSMLLASILELHGAPARPLFAGSNIIQATANTNSTGLVGDIVKVNLDPVYWAMQSDHIPIVQSIGESFSGQMLGLDVRKTTAEISRSLQPRKVLFINLTGGVTNEKGEVIPNINLPVSSEFYEQIWCTPEITDQIDFVSNLLYSLPQHSSVVFTAANKLLAELFTHHGSGTFFKLMEPVNRYKSLKGIDRVRLISLFNSSFGKELEDDYLESVTSRLTNLYLSEDYNAAAIITSEPTSGVPYLDKFSVSVAKQSEGTADALWDLIKEDHPKLFWRSRTTNPINPWYFKRCEGSWTDGEWIVFWYGRLTHNESSEIVDHALSLPSSFKAEDIGTEASQTMSHQSS